MAKFEKGHKRVGGRKAGSANIPCLPDALAVYARKGGIEWLEKWVDESAYNKREFVRLILGVALKQVAEKQEQSGETTMRVNVRFIDVKGGKE